MALIKISDLKVGMKIGKNVYNKDGVLLLEKEVRISSPKQVDILMKEGIKYVNATLPGVTVDEERVNEVTKTIDATEMVLNDITAKIESARAQINKVVNLTGEIFNKVIDENNINEEMGQKSKAIVNDYIVDIEANSEIYASLEEIKDKDQNLLNHSVHVCTNALLLGMHLNFKKEELIRLGTAALLHDMGKIKIDNRILSKIGMLTEAEQKELAKHPGFSEYYLRKMGNMDEETIHYILMHHEYYNGSGYPQGVLNTELNQLILVTSNIYNNLIANADISRRVSPVIALRKMNEMVDKEISREIYMNLLETIGFYPVGTLVQLENGDVGKVIMQNKSEPQHPKVLIKFDRYRNPKTKIVDTSLKTRAGSASKYLYRIVKVIDTR